MTKTPLKQHIIEEEKNSENSESIKTFIQKEVQSYFRNLNNNSDINNDKTHYISGYNNKEIQKTPSTINRNINKQEQKTSTQSNKKQTHKKEESKTADMEKRQLQIMQNIINLEEKKDQHLLNKNEPTYSDVLKNKKKQIYHTNWRWKYR